MHDQAEDEYDMSTSVTFLEYGKTFQEKIIQAMITDHRWARQISEVLRIKYFDHVYLSYLADKLLKYHDSYKTFPSFDAFITIVHEDFRKNDDDVLKADVIRFLTRVKADPQVGDLPFVKEKSLDFCRKQEIKESLERIVERVEISEYDVIVDDLNRAVNKGMCESMGHDFEGDRDARFVEMERKPITTGFPELDAPSILRGGVGRGELAVVVANTGVGKSHMLVQLGSAAYLNGFNVNHYTMELSENAIGLRYDSHITQIPCSDVPYNKDEVVAYENSIKDHCGHLIIKSYPTGAATIQTIRSHIDKCILQGYHPDMIIIDYADIMRSTRRYDSARFELKLIYDELRNLAMDLDIPVWTASQANRESANADIVGLENLAESYGKAQVADFIVSLSRKASEKATGAGRLHIAKNRAGRDGICWPVKIDTATSTITILDANIDIFEAQRRDKDGLRDALKVKWDELRHDRDKTYKLRKLQAPVQEDEIAPTHD